MSEPAYISHDDSELNVIFIHSSLDEIGLTANQFRIYAHLSRRAHSAGKAWPGIDSMAKTCRMHKETVIESIRELEKRVMVKCEKREGKSTIYRLTAPSKWVVGNGERSEMGNAPVGNGERDQSEMGNERKSKEGNPKKVGADALGGESSIESKVAIPAKLDCPEFRAAFDEWVAFRRERRIKPYTARGLNGQFAILSEIGTARAISAIKHSIAQSYQGIYESTESKKTNGSRGNGSNRNEGTYNSHPAERRPVERLAAKSAVEKPR